MLNCIADVLKIYFFLFRTQRVFFVFLHVLMQSNISLIFAVQIYTNPLLGVYYSEKLFNVCYLSVCELLENDETVTSTLHQSKSIAIISFTVERPSFQTGQSCCDQVEASQHHSPEERKACDLNS